MAYAKHLSAADRRAKAIIKACAATGAGIEFLPEAPGFKFVPAEKVTNSFKPKSDNDYSHRPPSGRGSITVKGNPLKLKNWSPSKLDANPMYSHPMRGDSRELTEARKAWARGDPKPLRKYLANLADQRRAQSELFEQAA